MDTDDRERLAPASQDSSLGSVVPTLRLLLRKGAAERRGGRRVPTDDPARMKVLYPSGGKGAEVRVLDVSRGGLRLRLPEFLQPGTIIQIQLKSLIAEAEIRYCVQAEEAGFYAGVELQDVAWTDTKL